MNRIIYKYNNINYSPKKLLIIISIIKKKSIHAALFELYYCNKRKISDLLIKYIYYIYNDIKLKYHKNLIFISEIYIGRTKILKKIDYHAKGKVSKIKHRQSNLTLIIKLS